MASDSELKNTYTLQYQELLDIIENLNKDHPEDVHGYNAFVKLARKVFQRASIVGVDSLDPTPPMK
ncbi:MAG: hypothetical protein LBM59_00310 [Ruminococcus sp.]|jgi:hypothetical protein|nr:hypothetical protein [Ruminococcus sp.]